MQRVQLDDVVMGQYKGRQEKNYNLPGCESQQPSPDDHRAMIINLPQDFVCPDGFGVHYRLHSHTLRCHTQIHADLDDATVPKGSLTPTFAAVAMKINNARRVARGRKSGIISTSAHMFICVCVTCMAKTAKGVTLTP